MPKTECRRERRIWWSVVSKLQKYPTKEQKCCHCRERRGFCCFYNKQLRRCYDAVWFLYGWCHVKNASVSAHFLYTMQPCTMPHHLEQSHIRRAHAYFAVTCRLHFWQNDRVLFSCYCRNTVTQENKILLPPFQGLEPRTF